MGGPPETAALGTSYVCCGLRAARLDLNMSKNQVALAIGVSAVYYGNIERGSRGLPVGLHEKLASVLSIPIEDLRRWVLLDYIVKNYGDDMKPYMVKTLGFVLSRLGKMGKADCRKVIYLMKELTDGE